MSLQVRLVLAILGLVVFATGAMWFVSSRGVFRPFATEIQKAFVAQAIYLAEEVEAGADPERIGRKLGCEVRLVDLGDLPVDRERLEHRPDRGRRDDRDRLRLRGEGPLGLPPGFTVIERDGRLIGLPPPPRDHVLVHTSLGWLLIRREIDVDRPLRQLRLAVLIVGAVTFAVTLGLAAMATRPLGTARDGMERIAAGDFDHRLDEDGPEEIARVARAFNAMADRIAASIRTERELMAGMSHELRTPLSRLRLEVELLRDAGLPEARLAQIDGDLTEIDGLVGQLLQLSRLQLGPRALQAPAVAWKDLVGKAVATLETDRVDVRGPGGTFRGDPDLLLRVAVNLVQNSVRYAPVGTRITVSCQGGDLVVEDEGTGVPPDQLPRLFDPFWRGDASRARATGGLGLGLMLVRQIALLHGGTASAENRVGGGLRVTVSLPQSISA